MRSSRPRISPGTSSPHRSHASRASRPLIGLGAGATPSGRLRPGWAEDAGARHRVMNFLAATGLISSPASSVRSLG
jgi:hypothetical protein